MALTSLGNLNLTRLSARVSTQKQVKNKYERDWLCIVSLTTQSEDTSYRDTCEASENKTQRVKREGERQIKRGNEEMGKEKIEKQRKGLT